jgi:hypothetical protein
MLFLVINPIELTGTSEIYRFQECTEHAYFTDPVAKDFCETFFFNIGALSFHT